jgi:hypothetical protein
MSDLQYCMHHDQDTWDEYDARGIYLTKVCDVCVHAKLAMFRKDVLYDPSYETDEPIEDES